MKNHYVLDLFLAYKHFKTFNIITVIWFRDSMQYVQKLQPIFLLK